jgi:hypothetical protein
MPVRSGSLAARAKIALLALWTASAMESDFLSSASKVSMAMAEATSPEA